MAPSVTLLDKMSRLRDLMGFGGPPEPYTSYDEADNVFWGPLPPSSLDPVTGMPRQSPARAGNIPRAPASAVRIDPNTGFPMTPPTVPPPGTTPIDPDTGFPVRSANYGPAEDEAAFRRSIDDNPGDSTGHAVFADWLTEQGRPEDAEFHQSWDKFYRENPQLADQIAGMPRGDRSWPQPEIYPPQNLPQSQVLPEDAYGSDDLHLARYAVVDTGFAAADRSQQPPPPTAAGHDPMRVRVPMTPRASTTGPGGRGTRDWRQLLSIMGGRSAPKQPLRSARYADHADGVFERVAPGTPDHDRPSGRSGWWHQMRAVQDWYNSPFTGAQGREDFTSTFGDPTDVSWGLRDAGGTSVLGPAYDHVTRNPSDGITGYADEDALRAAAGEDPTARGALADWLDEQGLGAEAAEQRRRFSQGVGGPRGAPTDALSPGHTRTFASRPLEHVPGPTAVHRFFGLGRGVRGTRPFTVFPNAGVPRPEGGYSYPAANEPPAADPGFYASDAPHGVPDPGPPVSGRRPLPAPRPPVWTDPLGRTPLSPPVGYAWGDEPPPTYDFGQWMAWQDRLRAAPEDNNLRGAFADWLDEHNSPVEAATHRRRMEPGVDIDRPVQDPDSYASRYADRPDSWAPGDYRNPAEAHQITAEELAFGPLDPVRANRFIDHPQAPGYDPSITPDHPDGPETYSHHEDDMVAGCRYMVEAMRSLRPTIYDCE